MRSASSAGGTLALVRLEPLDAAARHLRELDEHRLVLRGERLVVDAVGQLQDAEVGAVAADQRRGEVVGQRRVAGGVAQAAELRVRGQLRAGEAQRAVLAGHGVEDAEALRQDVVGRATGRSARTATRTSSRRPSRSAAGCRRPGGSR